MFRLIRLLIVCLLCQNLYGDNSVIEWNQIALEAIKRDETSPPIAARNLAIVQGAIFDALNSAQGGYDPMRFTTVAEPGLPPEVIVSGAAHRTLVRLYPNQAPIFDRYFKESLDALKEREQTDEALELGAEIAEKYLKWREGDTEYMAGGFQERTVPGYWEPSFSDDEPAEYPAWGRAIPFAIESNRQFRPAPPPHLGSEEYVQAFEKVRQLGRAENSKRTPEETEIAQFWENGRGTFTTPGHWNTIAEQLAIEKNLNSLETARLLALLNFALADAGIAAWDAKYHYTFWRPETAIQQAKRDGNRRTRAEQNWKSLSKSEPNPEYISDHSAFSGAAEAVLIMQFGYDTPFVSKADREPIILREYTTIRQAAEEAGISRVLAGTQFPTGNERGLETGRNVGKYVVENYGKSVPSGRRVYQR